MKEKSYLSPLKFISMKPLIFSLLVFVALAFGLTGCGDAAGKLSDGNWLGIIVFDSVDQVPFNFEVSHDSTGKPVITVINADERIEVTEIVEEGDTLEWRMPVFQSVIRVGYRSKGLMGWYHPKGIGQGAPYPFSAVNDQPLRYPHLTQKPGADLTGRWQITENPGQADQLTLIGEFQQEGSRLVGTILSPFGDYRYLEGVVSDRNVVFSGFDGSHAVSFSARIASDGSLADGRFAGSAKWKSKWVAVRNDTIALPPQEAMVRLKPDAGAPDFVLNDLEGNPVSLADERFRGKVVVVQASGTWCPNCMDEARLFGELYKEYGPRGLEVVSLFFESDNFEESAARIRRFSSHTDAGFTLLWAGKRGSHRRDSIFHMVEGRMAFPTTLYIDRKGTPRFVETGFSGPGTGKHYQKTVEETRQKLELLLNGE